MVSDRLPFFDPAKARGPRRGPDVGEESPAPAGDVAQKAPLTVPALLARIRGAMNDAFPQPVCVVGELSNVKLHASGHLYFRLKDASAAIDAVMFRAAAMRLKFQPTDGMEVVVEARVDLYEVRGQLQLYVEQMTPKGAGALELAFRQLVEKLRAEGLFEPAAKKPIPRFPRAIGVVSSPTGAAIRDIRRTLARRWPGVAVYLAPTLVQGEGAAEQIAQAIRLLDASAERYQIDTILLARGGGSIEDLWAFNEEVVARAIFAARTPIISGVGHEVDVTIADYVADVRAATPTAAAELAVPSAAELRGHLLQLGRRLSNLLADDVRGHRAAMESLLRSAAFRDPAARLRTHAQWLDELSHRLRAAVRQTLAGDRQALAPAANKLAALHPARLAEQARGRVNQALNRLRWVLGGRSKRAGDALAAAEGRLRAAHPRHRLALAVQRVEAAGRQLEALSYRNVLRRGFSVTRSAEGLILRSVQDVREGQLVETELADGTMTSTVGQTPAGATAAQHGGQTARPGDRPAADPQPQRGGKRNGKQPKGPDGQGNLFG